MTIKSIRTGWTGISALAGNEVLGDFENIQTVTVASTSATIEFTSIPSSYQHLQIRGIARTSRSTTPTQDAIQVTFNGDTGSNYAHHYLLGDGASTPTSSASSSRANILANGFTSSDVSYFGSTIIDILDYRNTNKYKTVRIISAWDANGSGRIWFESGLWQNTNAITSIKLVPNVGPNFLQHTHFALYGIR